MIIKQIISTQGWHSNCWLLIDEASSSCLLIDPSETIALDTIKDMNLTLSGILLTHGHYDHICAINNILSKINVPVYTGLTGNLFLHDPNYNLSRLLIGENYYLKQECSVITVTDGSSIDFAGSKIKVISTPGHTSDSVTYYLKDISSAFVGDTIFLESIGRTDFITGSFSDIYDSIRNKIFILPENTVLYTGHGANTSVIFEKNNNFYV